MFKKFKNGEVSHFGEEMVNLKPTKNDFKRG